MQNALWSLVIGLKQSLISLTNRYKNSSPSSGGDAKLHINTRARGIRIAGNEAGTTDFFHFLN